MIPSLLRAAAILIAMTFTVQLSHAQWTETERDEFYRDCLDSCRKNDKVPESQKGQCRDYCTCVMEGSESRAPNYKALNDDFLASRDTERTRAVRGLVPGCNRQAFPAR